jgi:Skp family chaperone for outer membrane proteins
MEQVRFSNDLALKNIDKMNAIEVEERKFEMEQLKNMNLVTTGAGFTSIFAPLVKGKGAEGALLTKVASDVGKNYLTSAKDAKKWEGIQQMYDKATTPLAKMSALRGLLQFNYNSTELLERTEEYANKTKEFDKSIKLAKDAGNTKKAKELEDQKSRYQQSVSLEARKEQDRLVQNLDNLIDTYTKIRNAGDPSSYSYSPDAKIRLTFVPTLGRPGQSKVLSIGDFLNTPLEELNQYAGKVELYNPTTKQVLDNLSTLNTLFKDYGEGKPSRIQPGTDFESYLRSSVPGLFQYKPE